MQTEGMKHLTLILTFVFSTLMFASSAHANINDKVVKLILGNCVQTLPRLDAVEAMARVYSWQELTKDQAIIFGPRDPNSWFRGWIVQDDNIGVHGIGISRSKIDGISMAVCSIVTQGSDVDLVVSKLEDLMKFKTQTMNVNEGGQRYRTWRTDVPAQGSSIIVIDAKPLKSSEYSISISTPDIYR